jgi:copper resistance protein D
MTLVAARWVHYAATTILFGISAYAIYAPRGVAFERWAIRFAAVLALASAVAWFGAETVEISGDPTAVFDPATLRAVLTETTFGRLWIFRLLLALAIVLGVCCTRVRWRFSGAVLACASGLLLVSLCGTGHAAGEDAFHRTLDGLHLAAAGLWLGGLCALVLRHPLDPRVGRAQTLRFSNVALAAVAILIATGIANAASLTTWREILSTAYGHTLVIKSALVVAMIAVAAVTRRALAANAGAPVLRRRVMVEQGFGALVLAATSVLGTLSPSGD